MVPQAGDGGRRAGAALLAAAAFLGVLATWWFFVTTHTGQRLDEIAFAGSTIGRSRLDETARDVLGVVSVAFLAMVIVVAAGLALLRRRWGHALAVAVVVGGANLSTQLLKTQLLHRPDLGVSYPHANSLPSGHTTVAATVMAAGILVVPPRWRWLAALVGGAYAAGTGTATMVAGWHRASDVIAALLVAAAWLFLALTLLARDGATDASGYRPTMPGWASRADAVVRGLLGGGGLLAGLAAAGALLLTHQLDGASRLELLVAYGGAVLGAVSVTCLTLLATLVLAAPHRTPRAAPGRPLVAAR